MRTRGHQNKTWIKIQELSKPVKDFDSSPAVWRDLYTVRANIEPVSGSEQVAGLRTESFISHRVSTRWLPGVRESMRVVIDDETLSEAEKRKLHIESITDYHDRKRDLELDCSERTT